MAVRSTMQTSLIPRVRVLVNDTSGSPIFTDQIIQDVMDEARVDVFNMSMKPQPTFSGSTLSWLDYLTELGGWEDGYVIRQYLTNVVTPATSEPIAGRWTFTLTTLPPLFITGKLFDVYRAAADLLERWAALLVLQFDFSSDGQSFRRSQQADALQKLAQTYRHKQRAFSISVKRGDIASVGTNDAIGLGPTNIDYFGTG